MIDENFNKGCHTGAWMMRTHTDDIHHSCYYSPPPRIIIKLCTKGLCEHALFYVGHKDYIGQILYVYITTKLAFFKKD